MISILRPSTPPLALISSAAICAACGIDAPAMAWASAMTPILIGSAAKAGLEAATSPRAVAPRSPLRELGTGNRDVVFIVVSLHFLVLFRCLGTIVTAQAPPASETAMQFAQADR